MHILASGPEKQAVYFGNVIFPNIKIVPPSFKRLINQTCMSKIVCTTGVLQEKVIHSIQSLRRIDGKQPRWEGPYQGLLVIAFAVRIAERATICATLWIHIALQRGRTH